MKDLPNKTVKSGGFYSNKFLSSLYLLLIYGDYFKNLPLEIGFKVVVNMFDLSKLIDHQRKVSWVMEAVLGCLCVYEQVT